MPHESLRADPGETVTQATHETLWPAPAKLNLFLHVTGRRPDGYHDLQTLFQLIELTDSIAISVRQDGAIERAGGPSEVPADADLTVRAARALQAASGTRLGASLRIRKTIPLGGGLGGGSSDAATALVALNRLWGCGLSLDRLAELGLALGSDVPVFVRGRSAWASGRGEQLTPVELPERWYLIVHPGVHVSTAEIFQSPELTRNTPLSTIRAFSESGGRNDCEPVVRARYRQVGEALDWLARFAPARLTGTGSCVFAVFESAADAERHAARVPDCWRGFVARGLNASPLHERLGRVFSE
jgi:4-diphosphocytidyl-2-C-methyl-D-erythritol kinase